MASAWGDSWGDSWGTSWELVAVDAPVLTPVGGHPRRLRRPAHVDYAPPPLRFVGRFSGELPLVLAEAQGAVVGVFGVLDGELPSLLAEIRATHGAAVSLDIKLNLPVVQMDTEVGGPAVAELRSAMPLPSARMSARQSFVLSEEEIALLVLAA